MNAIPLFLSAYLPANFERMAKADYDSQRELLLEGCRSLQAAGNEKLLELHRSGGSGRQVVEARTDLIDRMIQDLFHYCSLDLEDVGENGPCCIVAIGGYGRGELNPLSDIDLMFYFGGQDETFTKVLSERMLYLLWDLSLDVGYSVRTQKDCLEQMDRDVTVRTAMIDARYLAGDTLLWEEFENRVMPQILGKNSRGFIQAKLDEQETRRKKYGSSVYLLEPNIKEGEGGLRDIQTALWVAQVKFKARTPRDLVVKGILTEKQYEEIEQAFDYLWHIRNELHFLSGRKNEQLYFDIQEKIADFLGFQSSGKAQAVEQFMQDYYAKASRFEAGTARLIEQVVRREDFLTTTKAFLSRRRVAEGFAVQRGELHLTEPELFSQRPEAMMEAFELAQRHDVHLSMEVKDAIRASRPLVNDKVRRSREMVDTFFNILKYRKRMGEALRQMNYLRFLGRFIPEFKRIFCLVQHDVYHTYTVDAHSIFAVEELEKLWNGDYAKPYPLLTQLAQDVEKGELLVLAVLFHDIGKGEGKNHSQRGMEMMPTISRRLGLNKEDSERLAFLVEHHLQMAHIAQRRDLHDPKLIDDFAQLMGMSENLKMLYLLTFADIRAVGPDVWTDWKAGLLEELYISTYEHMEKGGFAQEARSERVRNRKRKVLEMLREEYPEKAIQRLLRGFGPRYLLVCPKAEISRHLRLMLERGEKPLAMEVEHNAERGYTGLTITTLDHPGLISQITGVLAAHGINILGAQIYTNTNGEILDTLQVTAPGMESAKGGKRWEKVEADLESVVEGRVRVADLVRKRQQPDFMTKRPKPRRANRVVVDNSISRDYTVIDIFAHDRIGLLYQITRTLTDLGLYIDISKISTKVDQAADTFYVKDIFGTKIRDPQKLEEIEQSLLASLDEEL